MKIIGIIGGLSPESTTHYYSGINQLVNERAGGLTSADMHVRSVNFAEYYALMERGEWNTIALMLRREALNLVNYDGCDYVAIATNTMHKVAKEVGRPIPGRDMPLVHIGDCIGEECEKIGAKRVLLLGTKFTMTERFMADFLADGYGIEVLDMRKLPRDVAEIDRIIFDELCHGIVLPDSKTYMVSFVDGIVSGETLGHRPDAVILGCTELDMILQEGDVGVPLIDSTQVHINKLVNLCLGE